MKNILLILKHEYITRVSKKSFIIMTLLGPVLIGLFYGSIAGISYYQLNKKETRAVLVHDPYLSLNKQLPKSETFEFLFVSTEEDGKKMVNQDEADLVLDIKNQTGDSIGIVAKKSLSISDKGELRALLSDHYFNQHLANKGLSAAIIDSMKTDIHMSDQLISGQSSATEIKSGIGYIGAFIIYLFIFMYGVMIMRGVTEEKNNRIVEIIVSAVKPFELMMGKILGVALVALTQFMAWIILSGLLLTVLSIALGIEAGTSSGAVAAAQQNVPQQMGMLTEIMDQLRSLNYAKIITGFLLFFFGGFLLYSSLFAAIGSAVDSDTETQQFMFPVSMPLIFGLVIAQVAVLKDPNSSLAVWSSMIPFTSPVVMMVRLPFDISWLEIISSVVILYGSFFVIVWLAGKIYRIGILSYGQKVSYKQLFKWLRMKD